MKNLIICSLVAALVAWVWGMISWMALPWHSLDFREFSNDASVTEVLRAEQQGSGLYLIPNMDEQSPS